MTFVGIISYIRSFLVIVASRKIGDFFAAQNFFSLCRQEISDWHSIIPKVRGELYDLYGNI